MQDMASATVLASAVIVPMALRYLCLWMAVRSLPPAETPLEPGELARWNGIRRTSRVSN
jgi:hypothetical protein